MKLKKFTKESLKLLSFFLYSIFALTSCENKLSEEEKKLIYSDIASEVYDLNAHLAQAELGEYLVDASQLYTEELGTQLQKDIDRYTATKALTGGGLDIAELFGTTTEEIIVRNYKNYVEYVNRHLEDVTDMAAGMAAKLNNSFLLNNNLQSTKEYWQQNPLPLDIFQDIKYVPSSIIRSDTDYENLPLNNDNKFIWGKLLFGDYRKPKINVEAILFASLLKMKSLKIPRPLYAVYNKDKDGWEIGFDNGQAFFGNFEKNGKNITYEFSPCSFNRQSVTSNLNNLKKNDL